MDEEPGSSEKEVTNNPPEEMEDGELPTDDAKESTSAQLPNKKPSPEAKGDDDNNEDEDQDDSGSTEEEDEEEDEETVDEGNSRLITSERKSLPPPKSAALSATENDVFAFHSSPEDDEPSKKFKRESPTGRHGARQYNAEEEDEGESRLQIDEDDEGDDAEPEEDTTESKKVPPLRILLTKTPSDEEDAGQGDIAEKPELKPTPHLKKPGKGKKNASNHPSRMTRARVRQAVEEGAPAKRRNWGRTGSSLIANADFEYEDYSLSPGLGADEDSQECETRQLLPPVPPPVRAWDLIQEDGYKGQAGLKKLIIERYQQQFPKSLEDQPPEPEIPNYEMFMINVKDYFLKGREYFEPLPPQINSILHKWPLPVRNLWIKQEKQRRLKSTEHEKERVRLQTFGEREYMRAVRSTVLRERNEISIIRLLRDNDACNPIIYDSFRPEPETPSMVPETVEQVIEKITKMANKLKDKQIMEVKSLHYLQKLEMEKLLKDYEFISEESEIDKCAIPMAKVVPVKFDYLEPMNSVEVKKPGPVLPPPEVIQALELEEEKFEDPPESILLNIKKEEVKEES